MKNEKERVTMSNIIDEVIKRCNMVAGTMKANKIFDFAVTGSAALAIEGVINRMPHDIDIKVSLRTGEISNERMLQNVSVLSEYLKVGQPYFQLRMLI